MIEVTLGSYSVTIFDNVLNVLSEYKQIHKGQYEAGGILLGQIKDSNIYVVSISVPSSHDKASRYTFRRSKEKAQIIIDHEFANSNKKTIYIGEWHTHPEKHPKPSPTDLKMIKDQFKLNILNEPFLLLLIQGTWNIHLGIIQDKGFSGMEIGEYTSDSDQV